MVSREKDCFGFPFSPSLKRCVSHEEMPQCQPKPVKRNRLMQIPDLDYLCVDHAVLGGCYHCYAGYICISHKAYVELCTTQDSSCSDSVPFLGSCLPQLNSFTQNACVCDSVKLYKDLYNENFYHYCDPNSASAKRETYQCPAGEIFNDITEDCEPPTVHTTPAPPTPPTCTSTGTYVNPSNCQYYYTCLPGGTIRTGRCEDGEFYSEVDNACLTNCTLAKPEITAEQKCPDSSPGKYEDARDCQLYYNCLGLGNVYSNATCPGTTHFDDALRTCVAGPLPADCKPFQYSACPGYDAQLCV
ncbi:hypothetical protein Pmani_000625 [Petrolisthes manimaculis]|uniref:Chitin-binding type-2 domain-containing protein n=1 Tax=Petrolisthes manimaculis TaxID=1843537 RepID=A0AAE1QLA1_9EUCA|nr:hypothetical protein Pmani_000625 [Petrolisthes manimaculis]